MVKIRELSDKQLLAQLEKYEKIYGQLVSERDKRVSSNGSDKGLLTAREAEEKRLAVVEDTPIQQSDKTEAFHLKFDDEELSQMEAAKNESKGIKDEEDDEVRVTQLLQLSKAQLAELRCGKKGEPKKVVKKKKVLKKNNG